MPERLVLTGQKDGVEIGRIKFEELEEMAFLDMLLFFDILKWNIYKELNGSIGSYSMESGLIWGIIGYVLRGKRNHWEAITTTPMFRSSRKSSRGEIFYREEDGFESCEPWVIISADRLKEIYDLGIGCDRIIFTFEE